MVPIDDEQLLVSLEAKHNEWEAAWGQRHLAAGEEVFYHYTDARGLLGIVQSGQLWASNAAFLNDSTEVVYIRQVLADVAKEFRAEYGVTADDRAYAVDAYARTGRFSSAERRAASVIGILEGTPAMAGGVLDVYVSCFCSNGDLLSQWRGYPSSGGGYALGLRAEGIGHGRGLLRRVIYDQDTQRQLLRDLLEPIVNAVAAADDEDGDPWDWLGSDQFRRVSNSLVECSFCFKHPGFREESEWRLVILNASDPRHQQDEPLPDIRPTRAGLLPYLKRPLEASAVAKVVVGPSSQPTLAAEAAARLLSHAGYENARDIVAHSAIPLRV